MARYTGQHGRKAFGAKRRVDRLVLAQWIAESIRKHRHATGITRTADMYTVNAETQALVQHLLDEES